MSAAQGNASTLLPPRSFTDDRPRRHLLVIRSNHAHPHPRGTARPLARSPALVLIPGPEPGLSAHVDQDLPEREQDLHHLRRLGRPQEPGGQVRHHHRPGQHPGPVAVEDQLTASWSNLAKVYTGADGTYSYSYTPTRGRYYRAVALATTRYAKSYSSTIKVSVVVRANVTEPAPVVVKYTMPTWQVSNVTPASSTYKTKLTLQRYTSGAWRTHTYKYVSSPTSTTSLTYGYELTSTGTYKFRLVIDPAASGVSTQYVFQNVTTSDPAGWKASLSGVGLLKIGMTAQEGIANGSISAIDPADNVDCDRTWYPSDLLYYQLDTNDGAGLDTEFRADDPDVLDAVVVEPAHQDLPGRGDHYDPTGTRGSVRGEGCGPERRGRVRGSGLRSHPHLCRVWRDQRFGGAPVSLWLRTG